MTVVEYIEKNNIDKDVTILNISGKGITSLKGIGCLNLTYLDCDNNQLTSLNGIESLKNLTLLFCLNNRLTSLKGIENLKNLTFLNCWGNDLPHGNTLKDYQEWVVLDYYKDIDFDN